MFVGVTERQLSVVVSDDSEAVKRRVVSMLRGVSGVTIAAEAATAAGTIETVLRVKPDVLILDIQLGDGSGIDVLKQVKPALPAMSVIMLTNHADDFYRRACLNAGASYFFDKSTEFARVGDALRKMVDRT